MNAHQRRLRRRSLYRSHQSYLAACARECSCCSRCWDVPCAGVCAGGLCDRHCSCGRDDGYDFDDDTFDYVGDDEEAA